MHDPRESHWKAAKHIIHYLKGTIQFGIKYIQCSNFFLSYSNSDCIGDGDDQKSTSGFVSHLSSRPLVWSSKKQKVVSMSTTEEEYLGVVNVGTEVVWI